jgi:hypothetical protein
MSTAPLIAIVVLLYALVIAEHVYQHRTMRHDLLRDALEAALRVRIEHHVGPHIFLLGVYFGERSHDLWLCLPFFMMRFIFKKH